MVKAQGNTPAPPRLSLQPKVPQARSRKATLHAARYSCHQPHRVHKEQVPEHALAAR